MPNFGELLVHQKHDVVSVGRNTIQFSEIHKHKGQEYKHTNDRNTNIQKYKLKKGRDGNDRYTEI